MNGLNFSFSFVTKPICFCVKFSKHSSAKWLLRSQVFSVSDFRSFGNTWRLTISPFATLQPKIEHVSAIALKIVKLSLQAPICSYTWLLLWYPAESPTHKFLRCMRYETLWDCHWYNAALRWKCSAVALTAYFTPEYFKNTVWRLKTWLSSEAVFRYSAATVAARGSLLTIDLAGRADHFLFRLKKQKQPDSQGIYKEQGCM